MTDKIYCVSKTRWAPMWRALRDVHSVPLISTWIDLDGEGMIPDWGAFWVRCLKEASAATCALVYLAPGDRLIGGMAEIGATLSHGKRVWVYGSHESLRTLSTHPLVHCCSRTGDFTPHSKPWRTPPWLFELAKIVEGQQAGRGGKDVHG